ncbi:MAG: hypothetical protein SGILL_001768, partial [Bacillariaceae sp.]
RKENSKFMSSLSAYRKNKSHRKVGAVDGSLKTTGQHDSVEHAAAAGDVGGPETKQYQTETEALPNMVDSTVATTESETNATDTEQRGPPSLGSFFDQQQQQQQQPPSLGSLLEQRHSHEFRAEVLRHNSDDSSVAIMAENFEKDAVTSSEWDETGNDGGGISDYMGWANLAIQACDTESVRGFEHSQNLDYQNYDDDDSTIATNYYDDDASIVSGMATPRGNNADNSYFDDYQSTGNFVDNVPSVTAKVAASILFNDSESEATSVDQNKHGHNNNSNNNNPYGDYGRSPTKESELIDMALSFNDVGLDAGLSFGGDVGFDDGLGGFGGHAMNNDLGPVGFDSSGGGGDFGGHQPFNEPHSPKGNKDEGEEKKAPTTATKSWFEGAKVAIASRTREQLEETVATALEQSEDACDVSMITTHVADVTNPQQVEKMVSDIVKEWGGLDILINNAGGAQNPKGPVDTLNDPEPLSSLLKLNVVGPHIVTNAVCRLAMAMTQDGGGRILNISSKAGKVGLPNYSFYVASKFALEGMTASWAKELKERNIVVNSISPGMVDTQSFPKPAGKPGVRSALSIRDCLLFALTSGMEYTGHYVHVDEYDALIKEKDTEAANEAWKQIDERPFVV